MKKTIITLLMVFTCLANTLVMSSTGPVTIEEARKAAESWVALVIEKKGNWNGNFSAYPEEIRELKNNGRMIGYYCNVHPRGFLILSRRKELFPITVYSSTGDFNPDLLDDKTRIIKEQMEKASNVVEQNYQEQMATTPYGQGMDDYHSSALNSWDYLIEGLIEEDSVSSSDSLIAGEKFYQEGEVLLSSNWDQEYPYNLHCPGGGDECRAKVGCVATAGSQIMRYWNWPPYGENVLGWNQFPITDSYDWTNMLDELFNDSPLINMNAVAELCHEVGLAVGMDYGCDGSSAPTNYMRVVYKYHFHYAETESLSYSSIPSPTTWFDMIKYQLKLNRPILYSLPGDPGHTVVVDGWQELLEGQTSIHIVWGSGNDTTTSWYNYDQFSLINHYMIYDLYPENSVGGVLSGIYERIDTFPYRYFDQDANGDSAIFEAGQNLQFLEDIAVTNTSATDGTFRFEGDLFGTSWLFTGGDRTRGIRINNGTIKLYKDGSLKFFRRPEPPST